METKAGKARPTLSSCSSPEAVVVGKGLGEGGCQSEPPLSLPAKVRSVLPAPQGVEGVQHRGLGQPLALVWSEGASGLQGAAGWAGRGGGLGECPMGMKTRRQVEGTVWRPDWPCVSRSGHDWVAGQDGLRPGEESSRHWWEAPWGRGGRRSPKGMFQKESEASVSSHRVKSLLTNT